MKVFRIDEIRFQPFEAIIAEDSDHAAQMLIYALMRGLTNRPGLEFSVAEWTSQRVARFSRLKQWVDQGRSGIVWRVDDDGAGWELVTYDFDRI